MLKDIINKIEPLNKDSMEEAKIYIDSLAKPLGSLGVLEDFSVKMAGITGEIKNNFNKKAVIIMCSDNGVVEEGVASAPQYVTLAQTKHFIKGGTGVAALAKVNNTKLIVVDIGINSDEKIKGVINRKIRKSTNNIFKEDAMTYEEAIKAIEVGIETVEIAKNKGINILGIGEMGIGNTTTSSAVLMSLLNLEVKDVVGKGAGLTDEAFEKKKFVIESAVKTKSININDPIDIMSKVGGFDICGMVGAFLGCAYYKIPVVIDGFISAVAALVAYKINPLAKEYMIPSHKSYEIGYNIAMKELNLNPILNLDMRLGEGSGCPIAFSVIDFSMGMINNMGTFKDANINDSYLDEVREEKNYKVDMD